MALKGLRVIEMAGLAPAPFCGRILSDFGADVIRIDRPNVENFDTLGHGKKSIAVNLKSTEGITVIKKLCNKADVLVEPYRPGVMEKLGIGPKETMASNPGLIYARLTGFGQRGPFASVAGHDINYIAISGILSMLGRKGEVPTPPINLLGDFAGGGLLCALGITLALFEREKSGKGQVIDANMVEGSAYISSWIFSSRKHFAWGKPRGENWLDSGTHFYNTYETKDGRYMAVGAIEPQFYDEFLKLMCLQSDELPQFGNFEESYKALAAKFKEKTMDEWCKIFDGKDACVTPVLTLDEAPKHPHNIARGSFVPLGDYYQPVPAPYLSRTPGKFLPNTPCVSVGQHTDEVLLELGYTKQSIEDLIRSCVVARNSPSSKL